MTSNDSSSNGRSGTSDEASYQNTGVSIATLGWRARLSISKEASHAATR